MFLSNMSRPEPEFFGQVKWNYHVEEIVNPIEALKIWLHGLVQFYKYCIRSVVKYAWPVFYNSHPEYLLNDLKKIKKRAMHLIYPSKSCDVAMSTAGLIPIFRRCEQITDKRF